MAMDSEAEKPDLGELRTQWADERTRMAGERTFAAWLRTGLALTAAGLGMARLLSALQPQWLVRAVGSIFVLVGAAIFLLGFATYRAVAKDLKAEEVDTTSLWFLGVLTIALVLAAGLALILIFV